MKVYLSKKQREYLVEILENFNPSDGGITGYEFDWEDLNISIIKRIKETNV